MRALIAACVLLLPATAAAFHLEPDFARPAIDGGGGGLSYSGSPRAHGYDCAICHVDASGAIRVAIASDPPELAVERRWEPGRTYRITVALTGLHRGGGARRDRNGFLLEILDDENRPAGSIDGAGEDVVVRAAESVATSAGERLAATSWSLSWTAPASGSAVHFWVAGVDGDGGGSDASEGADPWGDDAWSGVLTATGGSPPRVAGATPVEGAGFAADGCRQAGRGGALPVAVVVAWLALATAIRPRSRRAGAPATSPVRRSRGRRARWYSCGHAMDRARLRGGGAGFWL